MSNETFDFTKLMVPFNSVNFFDDYWEQQPLLVQGREKNYYTNLFTIADIESVLCFSRLKSPEIRVIKNQQELLPSTYINSDGSLI